MTIEDRNRMWPALLAALCLSCATPAPAPPPEPPAETPPPPPPGFGPRAVSIPDDEPRPAALRLLEESRYSLHVQDAELRGVLIGLGRDSSFNAIVEPGISGQVTAEFNDVSLREILDQLLGPRGYQYSVEGSFLRIFAAERGSRTYRIDYPNYERRGSSDLTISGAIASKPKIGDAEAGGEGAGDTSSAGVQTTQVVDFWTELEAGLRGIVFRGADSTGDSEDEGDAESSPDDGPALPDRSVVVARQAGLVTVTAETSLLNEVDRYLREIARSTQRQVLIDVKILEIDIGDDLDLGVDWAVAGGLGSAEGTIDRGDDFDPAVIAQELAPAFLGSGFMFGVAHENFSAAVSALAQQRDVKVISTPRLATLNNHKALIKVVRNQVFFVAEVKAEVVAQVGSTQVTEFVPQIVPVGVTLDLTPQISGDGHITMHIHPSISEVVDVVDQPQSNPLLDEVGSLPVIDLRETDTVMRVADGVTILIGGLIQSREFERNDKVPLLGDIPWVGVLFRQTKTEETRTELVILVTPQIMDAPMVTRVRMEAEESLEAIDALRGKRLPEGPWWRRPFGESYGEGVVDDRS